MTAAITTDATGAGPTSNTDVASPEPTVRRLLDRSLDASLVLVAWWSVLYWIGLATQWSLWPSGWVWLAGSPVLLWLTLRGRSPSTAVDPPRLQAPRRLAGLPPTAVRRLTVAALVLSLLVAVSAMWWPRSFSLVWVAATLCVLVAAFSRLPQRDATDRAPVVPASADYAALVLACGIGVLSLFIHLPDLDDPFYVNRSVWVAEHGNASTLDTMFSPEQYPTPYNGGLPIGSIEALLGVIARMSHLHVGTVTWVILTGLASAGTVWAMWRLARSWSPRLPLVVLVVAVAFLLMSGESRLGNFWIARIWQGKVIAVAILVPLVWVYVTQLVRSRERRPLVMLGVAGLAFVGLTSTAVILAPIMAGAVFLAALVYRSARLAAGAVLFGVGPVLGGVAVLLFSPDPVGGEDPRLLSASESFLRVLGPNPTMVALAVLGIALGALLVRSGPASVTLGVTTMVCLGLFVPQVLRALNGATGAGPILWRFLYCLPIAVLVGLLVVGAVEVAGQLLARTPVRRFAAGTPYAAVALVLALVAVVGAPLWNTTDHNGPAKLKDRPVWKADLSALADVEAVMASDPTGVILLPPVEMRTLAMYTTQAFAVLPRVWYGRLLDEPPRRRADRFALMELASGRKPLPPQERVTAALAELDVTLACVGPNKRRDKAAALIAGAGYVDPREYGRLLCLRRP